MRSVPVASYAKYTGLITVCAEWLALLLFYLLLPAKFNGQNPISYFASFPETRLVFSVCLTVAATSFWVFTRYHLPKYYVVPVRLFSVSMLAYAVLALLPFDPYDTNSEFVHKMVALLFSVTFLAGIYIMGRRNQSIALRRVSYAAVVLSFVVMFVFLSMPKGSPWVLVLEMLTALVGQVWVVWISFHSFSQNK